MKKIYLIWALAGILLFADANFGHAQFEGTIEFYQQKSGTTNFKYFVKGELVRIEEYNPDGSVKGIMIVNTGKKKVTALSPERKLFMDVTSEVTASPVDPVITKTDHKKTILDVECTEWIAKSKTDDTEISYWVGGSDFNFFIPLLETLNRKDKISKYFLAIPETSGLFTFEGVEKSLDGTQRNSLQVTKVEAKKMRGALFQVPKGYTKFEK